MTQPLTPPIGEPPETSWMVEDPVADGVVELLATVPAPDDCRISRTRSVNYDNASPDDLATLQVFVQPLESSGEFTTGSRMFGVGVTLHVIQYVNQVNGPKVERLKRYTDQLRRTIIESTVDIGHAAASPGAEEAEQIPSDAMLRHAGTFVAIITYRFDLEESVGYHRTPHLVGDDAEPVTRFPSMEGGQ